MGTQYVGINARVDGISEGNRVEVEFFPRWVLATLREEDSVALRKEDGSFYVAPDLRVYHQIYRFKVIGSGEEENKIKESVPESRS